MLVALTSAIPEQQAEIRERAAAQSLAEFTRTLQQRYLTFASAITGEFVAHAIVYNRQQAAATATGRVANRTRRDRAVHNWTT